MSTPNSSVTSYATPADITARYDLRTLGDWCGDQGRRVDPVSLKTDTNMLTALADASGDIESACFVSAKYSADDLNALTTQSLSLLKRICSDIACGYLASRRPDLNNPYETRYLQALEKLEQLRNGQRIFSLLEHAEAGLIDSEVETPIDVEARNMTTLISRRYFGRRSNEYYPPPAGNLF